MAAQAILEKDTGEEEPFLPLTAAILAIVTPEEQKQMLGETLFPRIQRMYPELARKITGMLLEMDNAELLHMLEDGDSLKSKVRENNFSELNRLLYVSSSGRGGCSCSTGGHQGLGFDDDEFLLI